MVKNSALTGEVMRGGEVVVDKRDRAGCCWRGEVKRRSGERVC